MAVDFSKVSSMTLGGTEVTKITDSSGNTLWEKEETLTGGYTLTITCPDNKLYVYGTTVNSNDETQVISSIQNLSLPRTFTHLKSASLTISTLTGDTRIKTAVSSSNSFTTSSSAGGYSVLFSGTFSENTTLTITTIDD